MKDEVWLTAAISDDALVAQLLLRLKDSFPTTTATTTTTAFSGDGVVLKPLPPTWGLRLPRSSKRDNSNNNNIHPHRRSPTTPLSFSGGGGGGCHGGASPSDGYEDSSTAVVHTHPLPSDRFRSKISGSAETPTTTNNKRPRRKKTFAELKEEECSLLKERTYLKKEVAAMRQTLKEERSINEKLKRRKLDLQEANMIEPEKPNTNRKEASEADSSTIISKHIKNEDVLESSSGLGFVLPDLNMIPDEDSDQQEGGKVQKNC